MELNEFQRLARETAVYNHERDAIIYPVLGLANEAGEVAGKVKKMLRGDYDHKSKEEIHAMIADELFDCLWYIGSSADDIGYTLDQIVQNGLQKLRDRKTRNVLKGDGDTR